MRDVRWILCGLALAAAACGRDGAGDADADHDGWAASADCDDHDGERWQLRPAFRDADGDGVGVGPMTMLCTGGTLPPGWATVSGDCDDSDPRAQAMTTAYRDEDGDGIGAGVLVSVCAGETLPAGFSRIDGDCDDADPSAFRSIERYEDADGDGLGAGPPFTVCAGAEEPAGWATIDGDCAPGDATRYQLLPYAYRDADRDGATTPEQGTVCSGAVLPPGYARTAGPADCDDTDASVSVAARGYLDADLDGVGDGLERTFCTADGTLPFGFVAAAGDCAPADAARWRLIAYASVDRDGDGVRVRESGSLCVGFSLPAGYFIESTYDADCNDGDRTVWTLRTGYADADGDGIASGPAQSLCSGAALPAGFVPVAGNDCAPADRDAWQTLTYSYVDGDGDGWFVYAPGSICTGATLPPTLSATAGKGSDCNDGDPSVFEALYAYEDADRDGFGAGTAVAYCTAGKPPDGWSISGGDCAPDDPAAWRSVPYQGVDADGDGYTVKQPGSLCLGDAPLPDPYRAVLVGNDCNDADATLWRYVVLYPDRDGDGVGTTPRIGAVCIGATIPAGTSIYGFDPDDTDPTRTDAPLAEQSVLSL